MNRKRNIWNWCFRKEKEKSNSCRLTYIQRKKKNRRTQLTDGIISSPKTKESTLINWRSLKSTSTSGTLSVMIPCLKKNNVLTPYHPISMREAESLRPRQPNTKKINWKDCYKNPYSTQRNKELNKKHHVLKCSAAIPNQNYPQHLG